LSEHYDSDRTFYFHSGFIMLFCLTLKFSGGVRRAS
jgi:hypothetical protein